MSDKMRDEFEAWIERETGFNTFRTQYAMTNPEEQQYLCHRTNLAWMSWQASRAAIVVEISSDIHGESFADGHNAALSEVEMRLKSAGLSFK